MVQCVITEIPDSRRYFFRGFSSCSCTFHRLFQSLPPSVPFLRSYNNNRVLSSSSWVGRVLFPRWYWYLSALERCHLQKPSVRHRLAEWRLSHLPARRGLIVNNMLKELRSRRMKINTGCCCLRAEIRLSQDNLVISANAGTKTSSASFTELTMHDSLSGSHCFPHCLPSIPSFFDFSTVLSFPVVIYHALFMCRPDSAPSRFFSEVIIYLFPIACSLSFPLSQNSLPPTPRSLQSAV